MILAEIKKYLMLCQRATLSDIALHVEADVDAVRGMLEHWMRKGKVRKTMAAAACGSGCCQCDIATTEIYQWLDIPGEASFHQQGCSQPCQDNR